MGVLQQSKLRHQNNTVSIEATSSSTVFRTAPSKATRRSSNTGRRHGHRVYERPRTGRAINQPDMVSSGDTALSLSFSVVNHGPDFPRRIACIQIKFAVAMKQFTGLVNFYIQGQ